MKKKICFKVSQNALFKGFLVLGTVLILCTPLMKKTSYAQSSPGNIGMYNANAMACVAERQIRTNELETAADEKELIITVDIKMDSDEKEYKDRENTNK